ncbi:MAG TPA: LAGLIDADG family homing endonuclease [Candidatus Paceibacterota bacterium]
MRDFRRFSEWNKDGVLLISHLLFDGEIYHGGCAYNNRSMALIERVTKAMENMYDFEPKRYKNSLTGVSRIAYYNVALSAYVKIKAQELLQKITYFPKSFKSEFLQSFFDDEGCIDFRPKNNCRRIRGYQKDTRILFIVQKLLTDFEIESKIQMPNEVVIVGKENLIKFQRKINFSRGVRINGKRSNSIWKQSLEKRDILQRAIASYQS